MDFKNPVIKWLGFGSIVIGSFFAGVVYQHEMPIYSELREVNARFDRELYPKIILAANDRLMSNQYFEAFVINDTKDIITKAEAEKENLIKKSWVLKYFY